jgi:RHS repeat-associated protein
VVYPSGRSVNMTFNDRGLPTAAGTYATGASYWPHGALKQVNLGNPLKEQMCYNSRLQVSGMRVGTGSFNADCSNQSSDLLSLSYGYSGTSNNGNVQSQTINVPYSDGNGAHTQSMTQNYGYDTLNRLSSTSENVIGLPNGVTQGSWSWSFGADAYGNLWGTNSLGLSAPTMASSSSYFDAATNRMTKYGADPGIALPANPYDAAGNLQNHPELCQNSGGACMQYDGEGRLTQVTNGGNVAHYDYDGEGRRVRKTETGSSSVTTVYVHDAGGNLMAEYNTPGGTAEPGVRYLTADHLGSTRLVTDGSGVVVQRLDYFPFGQTIPMGEGYGNRNVGRIPGYGVTSGLTVQFTGKERGDSVTEGSLDYFGARYYSAAQGRFTTPDPTFVTKARVSDPQQWNLYSYARNNPLKYIDPDGRELKLAIYYQGISSSVANSAAQGMVTKFQHAGVKNVSYELHAGSPGALTTLGYSVLPTPHSHLLEFRNGRETSTWVGQSIQPGNGGQNFGGNSAVDVTSVQRKTKSDTALSQGLANEGAHEVAHDTVDPMYHLTHPDSTDLMQKDGAADPNWLKDPTREFSPDVAAALRGKYNTNGEIETVPKPAVPPQPEKKQ